MNTLSEPRVPAARAHDETASGAAREAALARRIDALPWASIERDLERDGHAIVHGLLAPLRAKRSPRSTRATRCSEVA